jgi:hypothetical protein
MGNSKLRGGKKAHKKRVATRNQRIKTEQTAMQKMFNESIKQQLEELKKQRDLETSGMTETQE